jgi:hypothetical protein
MYELAAFLRLPVYQLQSEMPYEEYISWQLYFESHPIGWREDDRTMKLLMAQGVKEKPENLFSSFAIMRKSQEKTAGKGDNMVNVSQLKRSSLFSKFASAVGGDKLEF